MMPGDYEDHPEWDDMDIDQDDYNTTLYNALDALDAADDYNGDYEHSPDYPDINGMDSSMTDREGDDDDNGNNSDSPSSSPSVASGAASTAANAASAIARSFFVLATGAAVIMGSYQKSLAIRSVEAAVSDAKAGSEASEDGHADGNQNSGSGTDGENLSGTSDHSYADGENPGGASDDSNTDGEDPGDASGDADTDGENPVDASDDANPDGDRTDGENQGETSHSFRLVQTDGGEGNGTITYTYVCDDCGKEIVIEVNVGSKKSEEGNE